MEPFHDLDACLWEILALLDPEGEGEIVGEPWSSPAFDLLIARLSLCLRGTSGGSGPQEALFARSALLDRVSGLFSQMLAEGAALSLQIEGLNRVLNRPYSSVTPYASSHNQPGISRRI